MASGNTQRAAKVWNAILGIAEMTIPRSSYKTWLEKTTALSCVDGELFISVPDAFTAQYIQERLMVVLDTALRDVAGDGFSITLTVEGGKDTDLLPEELSKRVTPTSVNPNFIEQEDDKSATGLQKFNPDYTFDRFIVGDSNELAFAGAKAVAESPGLHFNPLVIYSEVGLGKTHLLHAIAHEGSRKVLFVFIQLAKISLTNTSLLFEAAPQSHSGKNSVLLISSSLTTFNFWSERNKLKRAFSIHSTPCICRGSSW